MPRLRRGANDRVLNVERGILRQETRRGSSFQLARTIKFLPGLSLEYNTDNLSVYGGYSVQDFSQLIFRVSIRDFFWVGVIR